MTADTSILRLRPARSTRDWIADGISYAAHMFTAFALIRLITDGLLDGWRPFDGAAICIGALALFLWGRRWRLTADARGGPSAARLAITIGGTVFAALVSSVLHVGFDVWPAFTLAGVGAIIIAATLTTPVPKATIDLGPDGMPITPADAIAYAAWRSERCDDCLATWDAQVQAHIDAQPR